jgi:hypothetical protein
MELSRIRELRQLRCFFRARYSTSQAQETSAGLSRPEHAYGLRWRKTAGKIGPNEVCDLFALKGPEQSRGKHPQDK